LTLSGGADVGDVLSHGLAWCPEYGAMEWMELLVQSVPLAILRDDSRRPKIPVPRTGDVSRRGEVVRALRIHKGLPRSRRTGTMSRFCIALSGVLR